MTDAYEFFQKQFVKEFSNNDIHAIRAMLDLGYEKADYLYSLDQKNNCLIDTAIGKKDIWADILRAGIASAAKFFCKKGILLFEFQLKSNSCNNSRHIELYRDGKTLYFARTEYPDYIPPKALYRPTYNNIQENLFWAKPLAPKEINNFVATYGDNGEHAFQYGKVGILGEKSWLHSVPLVGGAYKMLSKSENEVVLVDLEENFVKFLEKDDINGGKG